MSEGDVRETAARCPPALATGRRGRTARPDGGRPPAPLGRGRRGRPVRTLFAEGPARVIAGRSAGGAPAVSTAATPQGAAATHRAAWRPRSAAGRGSRSGRPVPRRWGRGVPPAAGVPSWWRSKRYRWWKRAPGWTPGRSARAGRRPAGGRAVRRPRSPRRAAARRPGPAPGAAAGPR